MANASQHTLLEAIAVSGPISRAGLAERTGLSRPAVSMLSRGLVEGGLVLEGGAGIGARTRAGRPRVLLSLNPGSAYFAGVYAAQDPLQLVLTDLAGCVAARSEAPLPDTPEALAATVRDAVAGLRAAARISRAQLRGIGLALTGLIDWERGVCLHAANLGWRNVPVAALLRRATGLPVTLDNDANAVAVAERLFGPAREVLDVSVVVLGDGIGCGHHLGGRLQRGHRGGAGEIAHLMVEPGGLTCRCGKRGCLDTVASRRAMLDAARMAGLDARGPAELEAKASGGNAAAGAILRRAGGALGTAIAHLIQIVAPAMVVVADVEGEAGLLHRAVLDAVAANVLPELLAATTIRFEAVGRDVWARGAASLATRAFLAGADAT